ncbi:WXG100 family type VII secretion target [Nocardia sp. NPDC052566]|uniref:WXG100 family type VII secretion target n=1 Tax=Nocardia sp. NPDC052566 TaxID=3364330 RepID=UPI0037C97DCE
MGELRQTSGVMSLSQYMDMKEGEINGMLNALDAQKEALLTAWRSPEARPAFDRVIQQYRDEATQMVRALRDHGEKVAQSAVNVEKADSLNRDDVLKAGSLAGLS